MMLDALFGATQVLLAEVLVLEGLVHHLLALLGEHLSRVAHVLSLLQVLVPRAELLHHAARLVGGPRLLHQLLVLDLARPLQRQVRLLLPLLVNVLELVVLLYRFSRLVLALPHHPAVAVHLLEGISLLKLVPLHHSLPFGVLPDLLVVNHVKSGVLEVRPLVLLPHF